MNGNKIALGTSFGLMFGCSVGAILSVPFGIFALPVCGAIGMLVGMIVGKCMQKK